MHTARQTYTRAAASPIPQASRLAAAYQRGGVRGFLRAAGGSGHAGTWQAVERYARSGGAGKKLISDFLGQLGPIGNILGAIVGHDKGKATLPGDLRHALDFLKAFSDQPSVIGALQRILEGRGAQVVWPGGSSGGSPGDLPKRIVDEISRAIEAAESGAGRGGSQGGSRGGFSGGSGGFGGGSRTPPPAGGAGGSGPDDGKVPINVDGDVQRLPKNHPLVTGEMIETPQSSNVYAFGFDNDSHSLFVRFKDATPAAAGGHRIKSVYGSSGHGRPHKAGPLYLYHNVPARLFLNFIDASSKGSWVWEHLRIEGTLSGHQYDYALVGVQGGYVPRKATLTPLGEEFIPRTIFTDKGRSLSSPLPQELVRPLVRGFHGGGLGRPPNDGRNGLGGGRGRR